MKAVILAGGLGTRISEESHDKPKPMIEIGGLPILWHIMKIYGAHGINDFIICCGYKGYVIKEYFSNYFLHTSDLKINVKENSIDILKKHAEPWTISLIDTGKDTMTGGRIKYIEEYIDDTFCLTYGDGVSDINISELIKEHKKNGKEATITAVQPSGRFGALKLKGDLVDSFEEKPAGDGMWINGGFFVCEPGVFDRIEGQQTVWEKEPLQGLASDNQLAYYKHSGFWMPMDTLRDKNELEDKWKKGKAPWKIWK